MRTLQGYYFREGRGEDKTNFILHFQGGGWCFNETYCEQRSRTDLGSSMNWPQTTTINFATFQDDCDVNFLCNYSTVYIKYCDGSSFSSAREGTVLGPNGTAMYMRGAAIRSAVIRDLVHRHGLGAASPSGKKADILVGGCSAGGMAAILHADAVRAQIEGELRLTQPG